MRNISGYLKIFFLAVCFLFLAGTSNTLFAQVSKPDTVKVSGAIILMDFADYFKLITKMSLRPQKDSSKIKSLGPFFTPFLYPGYAIVTSYLIGLAGNISFYSHAGEDAKISSILIDNIFSVNRQFFTTINSSIYTDKEKLHLIGDWRFYKFPTYTYGLGSETTVSDKTPVDYSQVRFYEVAMAQIVKDMSAGIGYNLDYHWDITETKSSPTEITDFDRYGFTKTSSSSGVTLNAEYDSRLNSNNPHHGTYVNLQIRNNLKILASDNNWQSLVLDARHYIPVSKTSKNVLAFWSYDWFTLNGKPPYFDLPTTGFDAYNNLGRGYVQGRFKGLNMVYAEAEYRFRIIKNGFLGGVLFSNAASFTDYPNNKFNGIDPANGVGIRIKMNKHSDINLCIDYGVGLHGEQGFVFNLGEVF